MNSDFEMNGTEKACPKCGLEFKDLLHPFCTHKECPPREYSKRTGGYAARGSQPIPEQAVRDAAPELLEALETAMQWIKAWDVGFLFDEEWPADEAKILSAIRKARGEKSS